MDRHGNGVSMHTGTVRVPSKNNMSGRNKVEAGFRTTIETHGYEIDT